MASKMAWRLGLAVCLVLAIQVAGAALPLFASAEDVAAPVPGYLDWMLDSSNAQLASWMQKAQNFALYLFGPLVMIQAVLGPGKASLRQSREEALVTTLDFVFRKGLWLTLITQADVIAPAIVDTLANFGQSLGGGDTKTAPVFYAAVSSGLLMNTAADAFDMSWTGVDGRQFIVGVAACAMSALSMAIAWVIGLTIVASKIVMVGGLPLVGLAGLDATARFGIRYVEALLRLGIRLMVLTIIVVLAQQFTGRWSGLLNDAPIQLLLESLADCFGILVSLLVFPSLVAAIANGAVGDSGEGKVGGFVGAMGMTAVSMGVAAGVGTAMSKMGSMFGGAKGSQGGNGSSDSSGAERAERVMKAAGTRAENSGGNKGGGAGAGADSGPAKPTPPQHGRVRRAVQAAKKVGGAGARAMRRPNTNAAEGEDGDE